MNELKHEISSFLFTVIIIVDNHHYQNDNRHLSWEKKIPDRIFFESEILPLIQ